jgi:hypothetical protein
VGSTINIPFILKCIEFSLICRNFFKPNGTKKKKFASATIYSQKSYFDVCPPQKRRIISRVPEWEHIRPLLRMIGSGSVEAETDGSHDPHLRRATGSWILSTRDGKLSAKGVCPVDGDLETLDSYRAELDAIRCLLY